MTTTAVDEVLEEYIGGRRLSTAKLDCSTFRSYLTPVTEIHFSHLSSVEQLSCIDLKRCSVPPGFFQFCLNRFPGLQRIFLENCSEGTGREVVPAELPAGQQYPNINYISLAGNDLTELPESDLPFFPNLQFLNVSNNQLRSLPSSFVAPSLDTLLISKNEIKTASFLSVGLVKLRRFEAVGNLLTSLPASLDQCTSLQELVLDSNPLHSISLAGFKSSLQLLHARHLLITDFDAFMQQVSTCDSLLELNLHAAGDGLHGSPPSPDNLLPDNLELFNVSYSPVFELPETFSPNLTRVDLSGLLLSQLPDSLSTCTKLKHLRASNNQLTRLPSWLSQLVKLEWLDVSNNKIAELKHSLPKSLLKFDFSYNCVRRISEMVFKLCQQLTYASIAHNQLVDVPSELLHQKNLHRLNIYGNSQINRSAFSFTSKHCVVVTDGNVKKAGSLHMTYDRSLTNLSCPAYTSDSVGRRSSMEDVFCVREYTGYETEMIAVFCDGHGGDECAFHVANELPDLVENQLRNGNDRFETVAKQQFIELNEKLRQLGVKGGCTCVLAHITPSQIQVAHVGDSRAMLIREGDITRTLTEDHCCSTREEVERVLREGGRVSSDGAVGGMLGVSRAFGDFDIKGLTAQPATIDVARTDDDIGLLLACDGVWDVLGAQQVSDIITSQLGSLESATAQVVDAAIASGSSDNVSVVLLDLRRKKRAQPPSLSTESSRSGPPSRNSSLSQSSASSARMRRSTSTNSNPTSFLTPTAATLRVATSGHNSPATTRTNTPSAVSPKIQGLHTRTMPLPRSPNLSAPTSGGVARRSRSPSPVVTTRKTFSPPTSKTPAKKH